MKLLFILPAIGKKNGEKYIGTWKMAPLTLATLKALTPAEHEVDLYDDRIETREDFSGFDACAIVVETYTAKRAYTLAARLRELGTKVILGGYHIMLAPKEAAEYADALVIGSAESVWGEVIADLEAGTLQEKYNGVPAFSHTLPDIGLYNGKKYLPVSLVETGRGCVHNCEFCAITAAYEGCYHKRPMEDILRDVEQNVHRYFFLVDDNLIADRKHALELFQALEKRKIKWAGQGTLTVGRDPELLRAMKKSGCEILLIGFESLNAKNLIQMGKRHHLLKERDELVQKIHDAGINIYATFVFGYDEDDEETIAEALAFSKKHRFYTAAFNHLLPFPGTSLYDRLKAEGKLLYDKWWLAEGYHYGELAFRPKKLSPEELATRCFEARKAFNTPKELFRRFIQIAPRSSPMLWLLFWAMNVSIGNEVSQKMNVPLGENLDESPK